MQSYEAAGGYGAPDYYAAGADSNSYDNSFPATNGGGGGATRGFRGASRGDGMNAGRGGRGASRGGGFGFGRGGPLSGRGGGPVRGGRGGGGRGGSNRFNPMSGGGGGGKPAGPPGHIVFAYNIGSQTGEDDVRQLFALYGTVNKVDVIWDHAKNQGKGFAFVNMPNYEEAEYAIQKLNGYNYSGKPLQVSFKTGKL